MFRIHFALLLAPDGAGAGAGVAAGAGQSTGAAAGSTGDAARNRNTGSQAGTNGAGWSKTTAGSPADAGDAKNTQANAVPSLRQNTPQPDKGKLFADMVNGEYKAEAERWFQDRFDRRHRDYKLMQQRQEAMEPAVAMLQQVFGWDGKDPKALVELMQKDKDLWETRAAENGMDVDRYREWVRMQAENKALTEALQRRHAEERAAETRERYEQQFDAVVRMYPGAAEQLRDDFHNEQFLRMIDAGVDMLSAFQVVHQEQILSGAMQYAAQQAEHRVTDTVAANQRRPVENGTGGQVPAHSRPDVNKMTRQERLELEARARRGERIVL